MAVDTDLEDTVAPVIATTSFLGTNGSDNDLFTNCFLNSSVVIFAPSPGVSACSSIIIPLQTSSSYPIKDSIFPPYPGNNA